MTQAAVYCSHRTTFHARQRSLPCETDVGRDGARGGETVARKVEGATAAGTLQLVGNKTEERFVGHHGVESAPHGLKWVAPFDSGGIFAGSVPFLKLFNYFFLTLTEAS